MTSVTFQNVDLETIMRPTNEDYYHGLLAHRRAYDTSDSFKNSFNDVVNRDKWNGNDCAAVSPARRCPC
jgi:hypothetical protein